MISSCSFLDLVLTLMSATSRIIECAGKSFTLMTFTILCSCFSSCSDALSSPKKEIVMRETSGFVEVPTVSPSMLKFLLMKRPEIRASIPGSFATILATILLWPLIFCRLSPYILTHLVPCLLEHGLSADDMLQSLSRREHGQDVVLLLDMDIYDDGLIASSCLFKRWNEFRGLGVRDSLEMIRLRKLHEIRIEILIMDAGLPVFLEDLKPLPNHSKASVVHDDRNSLYAELLARRKLLRCHLKAPIPVDIIDIPVRRCDLRSHGSGDGSFQM